MVYLLRFCNGIWIRKYDQKELFYALVAIESIMVYQ